MASSKSSVSIASCPSYEPAMVEAAVRRCMDDLGGMGRFVQPGMRVLLKPNLLAAKEPSEAITTHPAVVAAVARLVQEAGGQVTVADSPGGPFVAGLMKKVYAATGMDKVAEDTGLVLSSDFGDTEVTCPDAKLLKRLRLISAVAGADVVINLPKLKTHGQMVYTGAVKNMFGAIPGTEKIEYHMRMAEYGVFADALIDIFLACRPVLNLMDAVVGMEGAGPSAGDPRQIGLILCSDDAFALDYVALGVVGADASQVPVIQAARARGLCPTSIDDVNVLGCRLEEVRVQGFDMPAMDQMLAVGWSRQGPVLRWLSDHAKPRPVFDHSICTGCGVCRAHCPAKVISMVEGQPRVDLAGCIRCFCCQELCPAKAITIHRLGRRMAGAMRIAYFLMSMIASRLPGGKPR